MQYPRRLRTAMLLTGATLLPACLIAQPLILQSKKTGSTKQVKPANTVTANPKQENQFISVEEFVKAKRSVRTAVSVEGYVVLAVRGPDGSLRLSVVDSVDHVLNTTDADNFARGGAIGIVPAASLAKRANWGWTAKGMQKLVMYTGAGRAQKALHDIVAKVRVTGFAVGKSINPVTKIEYQDESGEWKAL